MSFTCWQVSFLMPYKYMLSHALRYEILRRKEKEKLQLQKELFSNITKLKYVGEKFHFEIVLKI